MTDKQKHVEYLKSLGFKEDRTSLSPDCLEDYCYWCAANCIYTGSGKNGYYGTYSWFSFDNAGKFTGYGAAD